MCKLCFIFINFFSKQSIDFFIPTMYYDDVSAYLKQKGITMFLKKEKEYILNAFGTGQLIPIEEVPDAMFANKLMGEGVAIIIEKDTIYAPCDVTINVIAETKHAIAMTLENGCELLIHIGLDTVNFNGEGFHVLVKENQKVKKGDPIVILDLDFFAKNNCKLYTPLVILNHANYSLTSYANFGAVSKEDGILAIK